MKHWIILCFALLVMALCVSCGAKCDGYAPSNVNVSWSEYNSVDAVFNFFKYSNTAKQHTEDTIRVMGYALGYGDSNYYKSLYDSDAIYNCVSLLISDDPEKQSLSQQGSVILLSGDTITMAWLKDYKAGQLILAKGSCYAADPMDDKGCRFTVEMTAVDVNVEKTTPSGTVTKKLLVQRR